MRSHRRSTLSVLLATGILALPAACDRSAPSGGTGPGPTTSAASPAAAPNSAPAASATAAADTARVALRYEIDGMHCSGCVDAICSKVSKIPGIAGCTVDLDTKLAVVDAGSRSDDAAIRAAIERLGYKVRPLTAAEAEAATKTRPAGTSDADASTARGAKTS